MEELVTLENDQAVTTSLQIAENFNREHGKVIRSIETLINDLTENDKPQVASEMFYLDMYTSRGKKYPQYLINKDGFSLLVMGFNNNDEVLDWKLKYIEAFNQMEKQLKEVYHISETALTNSVVKELKEDLFHEIDGRFEMYEENYRPTHANKIRINKYIKERLGSEQEENEAELVKQRVLLMLNAEHWQDIPYKQLINNLHLIDQSIETVKGSRARKQMELFNDFI